jgi:hypothetical protein
VVWDGERGEPGSSSTPQTPNLDGWRRRHHNAASLLQLLLHLLLVLLLLLQLLVVLLLLLLVDLRIPLLVFVQHALAFAQNLLASLQLGALVWGWGWEVGGW